jgi:drug/metabolite transporter (DMT)-like permease
MATPGPEPRPRGGPVLAMAVLALIWGYNWVIMKNASHYAGPFQFAALRTVFGALALFAVLVWRRQPLALVAPGPTLLLGLLQTAGFTALTQWALVSGAAGKTAVLAYTMPFWLLLLAWPLLHERLRGPQWLAVAIAAAGLLFILEPGQQASTLFSDGLAIAGGLSWAASAVVAKRIRQRHTVDLLSLTAWQLALGAVVLVVIALLVPAPPMRIDGYLVFAVTYTAVIGTGLAWQLWLYILDNLPAGIAGLATLTVPAVGVLAAWIELGERPDRAEWTGMLLICGALLLLALPGLRSRKRAHALRAPRREGPQHQDRPRS